MDYTFILEWENAMLSELDRTEQLLKNIHHQAEKNQNSFELLILHNSEMVSENFIFNFLKETIQKYSLNPIASTKCLDAAGAHYFQLKNKGAKEASGDSVIILDSDIIPSDNWLTKMIEGHLSHPNALVGGLSYIDYSDFIGKCFALSWFFPLPTGDKGLKEANFIFSNNFICKKSILVENPYPKLKEGVTRGADSLLWKKLQSKGIKLFSSHEAIASHPAPNGIKHFFTRALAEGRDEYYGCFENEYYRENPTLYFFKIIGLKMKKVFKRTIRYRKNVDLPLWQIPFAIITMIVYYGFYLIGGLLTIISPKLAKTSWQI